MRYRRAVEKLRLLADACQWTTRLPVEKPFLVAAWLVDSLRLDKGGFAYWWRSRHEPVWNHVIREPVRFWSLDGPDEAVLGALGDRRFADLPKITATSAELRRQARVELDRALGRLRAVQQKYWDRDWRREHRGLGRYPENHLWEATEGYLDLLENVHRRDAEPHPDTPAR